MERGFYSYIDKNKDIRTLYTVEYTRNREVFDMMGTAEFDFDMLDKRQFQFLEDAVSFWNALYYSESVLHVMLYEQILLDGEVILEQSKEPVLPSVLDKISQQRVKQAETRMELYKAENEKMKTFLSQHGINTDRILKDCTV